MIKSFVYMFSSHVKNLSYLKKGKLTQNTGLVNIFLEKIEKIIINCG